MFLWFGGYWTPHTLPPKGCPTISFSAPSNFASALSCPLSSRVVCLGSLCDRFAYLTFATLGLFYPTKSSWCTALNSRSKYWSGSMSSSIRCPSLVCLFFSCGWWVSPLLFLLVPFFVPYCQKLSARSFCFLFLFNCAPHAAKVSPQGWFSFYGSLGFFLFSKFSLIGVASVLIINHFPPMPYFLLSSMTSRYM